MKLFIPNGVLILCLASFAVAKSFDLGNFFRPNHYRTSNNSPSMVQPHAFIESERAEESNASFPSNFSKEIDSTLFDSSEDLESLNSTSESHEKVHTDSVNDYSTTTKRQTSTTIQNNNSASTSTHSPIEIDKKSTNVDITTEMEASASVVTEEEEEVVMATVQVSTVPIPKTVLQKSIEWVEDAYTLSILMPVAAGVLFATSIILTIACCRCVKRCCRRRRFKRKVLPDSVKNLSSSDRARLLGDTSDEEF